MIPHVGQTVLCEGIHSNGVPVQPAVITRVWSPGQSLHAGSVLVNLAVLPDLSPPVTRGSIPLFLCRKDALASSQGPVAYPVES